jgi:hypothetical protein
MRRFSFYLTVGFISLMFVAPVIAFMINAFAFRWFYPQFIPNEWSLQAWERLKLIPRAGDRTLTGFFDLWASVPDVVSALWLSLAIGAVVTGLSVIIGLPAARALGLYKFRGKRVVEFMIITPTIVPPIAFSLGLNINFIRWDLALQDAGIPLDLAGSAGDALRGANAERCVCQLQPRFRGAGAQPWCAALAHLLGRHFSRDFAGFVRGRPLCLPRVMEPISADLPDRAGPSCYAADVAIFGRWHGQ